MPSALYHTRRLALSHLLGISLRVFAGIYAGMARLFSPLQALKPRKQHDALDPGAPENLENPYAYYRRLRDEHPVYRPPGQDFFCVSRYEDIQDIARQTDLYSSNIVSVLMDKLRGAGRDGHELKHPGHGSLRNLGVNPVDVLAIQDPPAHKYQKLLTHQIVSAPFVRALEEQVQELADQLISEFLPAGATEGRTEFMDNVAWKLPMLMAMRLVGFPEKDFPQVKEGCADAIKLISGLSNAGQFAQQAAGASGLFRYCWNEYQRMLSDPPDNITGGLIQAANDPEHPLTHEEAVSIILQLLIAGSDSSASTMGNALRLLIENPELADRLRAEPARIADFIEEVFRLESAFQGHFRVLRGDAELHGVKMPAGSRVFLLWASGNRDERFWPNPDVIDIDRDNIKRHLTFGYGIHACLGRELARMEIRILLDTLLKRTRSIRTTGETPHVASLFTRTLLRLPIAVEAG